MRVPEIQNSCHIELDECGRMAHKIYHSETDRKINRTQQDKFV